MGQGVAVKIDIIDQEFLGTPHAIASFLVHAPDGYILVESGPATVQEVLEQKVKALGVEPADVKHVLVSHIHLDHSGGAGYWAKRGATVYVHPKGARHLIDPERLLSSAKRIYLDQMDYLWGTTIPIPADQVVEMEEGVREIAGLKVEALNTPGHAAHHLAFKMEDVIFTGDVGACSLPGSDYVSVPAPPPEFQLETWLQSLQKLRTHNARRFYLTHFGEVQDPENHLNQLEKRLQSCVEFVIANRDKEPEELTRAYQAWDREQAAGMGVDDTLYQAYERANPAFMSTQGILRYLRKKEEAGQ